MTDRDDEGLARYVQTDLSDQRVERVWNQIAARLPRRRRRRPWVWAGAATFAMAAAVIVLRPLVRDHRPDAAWQDAQLEAAAQSESLTLPDGSFLTLEAGSKVDTTAHDPSNIRVALGRGRILCDVTHRAGRSFVVVAEGVEVRVVGTRFSVAREQNGGANRVEVQVERGAVEVRVAGADRPVRVEAGHAWSQTTRTEPLEDAPPTAPAPPVPPPPPRTVPAGRPHAPPARAAALPADGRALFERARDLWRDGQIQEAADRYQELLNRYPRDARAGLAAFELGRLRMDRLHDVRGAAQAFQRAVELAPGAELREDALARLVAAQTATGDMAACRQIQRQYLGAYPEGMHRRAVAAACGPR